MDQRLDLGSTGEVVPWIKNLKPSVRTARKEGTREAGFCAPNLN
jgi:hypothetical protein